MQKEHASSEPRKSAPSVSTSTSGPPSTVLSGATQSSAATSIYAEEDAKMGEDDDAYHGGFGDDGDDDLEREDNLNTGADKQVSEVQHILAALTSFSQVPVVAEITEVPDMLKGVPTLVTGQKRKGLATVDIDETWEDDFSGAETELEDDLMEEDEDASQLTLTVGPTAMVPAGRRLTPASRFTNQVCQACCFRSNADKTITTCSLASTYLPHRSDQPKKSSVPQTLALRSHGATFPPLL